MHDAVDKPIPIKAAHRISDMLSETSSPESKSNAARWYAEMMVDIFMSESIKSRIGVDKFKRLSLGEMIKEMGEEFGKEIRDILLLIKDFGDRGSHYNPDVKVTDTEAENTVKRSIDLFTYILIYEFRKMSLSATPNRATILSTIFPSVREKVLLELLDSTIVLNDEQLGILHKYCLACTKNGLFAKLSG